jgi:tRNA C32,U32 (ribose-2'-O)-methylase TrmJ
MPVKLSLSDISIFDRLSNKYSKYLSITSILALAVAIMLYIVAPAWAETSAIIFSIINTAAANNLDAYKYLEYIFCQLPNINFASDAKFNKLIRK